METISHIAPHIEVPYHCFEDGGNLASILLDRLIGEEIVLDLEGLPLDAVIGRAEMYVMAEQAGSLRLRDIVFFRTGFPHRRASPEYQHRPSLTAEAMNIIAASLRQMVTVNALSFSRSMSQRSLHGGDGSQPRGLPALISSTAGCSLLLFLLIALILDSGRRSDMVLGFVTEEQAQKLHRMAQRLEMQGLRDESDVLRAFLDEIGGQSTVVGTAEAAEILSVTQQTIRNWIRAGILAGGQDATGRFSVSKAALVPTMRMRQALPVVAEETISDEDIDAEIDAVRNGRRAATTISR